ncbi:MAG: type II secretory pathway component PulF [Arenicella sp.]|jgi:type II secretory pathway component PulF
MLGILIWAIIIILLFIIPPVKVWFSNSVAGWPKFTWFVLSFLFSWIGFVAYYNRSIAGRAYKVSHQRQHSTE